METETATLIAAIIAAASSSFAAVAAAVQSRSDHMRAAHRAVLQPHVEDLGAAIYEVVALTHVIHLRMSDGKDASPWRDRAARAASELKNMRLKVRVILPGFDEGLRPLTRLSDWVIHCRGDQERAEPILSAADELRQQLDHMLHRSYRLGIPPGRWSSSKLEKKAHALIKARDVAMGRDVELEP